jgi:hypothetical protein
MAILRFSSVKNKLVATDSSGQFVQSPYSARKKNGTFGTFPYPRGTKGFTDKDLDNKALLGHVEFFGK